VALASVVTLLSLLRSILFLGTSTIGHDNILWAYPIFQFFAEGILQGRLPYWNPFTHGGEPFYPLLPHIRLLDPLPFLVVGIGQFFTRDLLILFQWDRVVRVGVAAVGIYLVLRPWARHLLVRLSLIPILLFSSFMTTSFRQDAVMNHFIWVPYVTFFLLRILYAGDVRWRNWFALAAFIGLNGQSLFFVGVWMFLLFFMVGLGLFRRDLVLDLFRTRRVSLKLLVLAALIGLMALPDLALFLSRDRYVFPPRMASAAHEGRSPAGRPLTYESDGSTGPGNSLVLPYRYVRNTGTFSTVWDFIQVVSPDGNSHARGPGRREWGGPSEAFIYVGLIPFAVILLGLVRGLHDLKAVWMLTGAGFGLLMLGPDGGLHRILYPLYPPLWVLRHTHALVLFLVFAGLYFYVLGANYLCDRLAHAPTDGTPEGPRGKVQRRVAVGVTAAVIVVSVYLMTELRHPGTNYLFALIAPAAGVLWMLRKELGPMGMFGALLASSLLLILLLSPSRLEFIIRTGVFLGLPALLLWALPRLAATFRPGLPPMRLAPVLLLFLVADLCYYFIDSSFLYTRPRPDDYLFFSSRPRLPRFPTERLPYPPDTNEPIYGQSMRYLSLIYRKPYALEGLDTPSSLAPSSRSPADDFGRKLPGTIEYGLAHRRSSTLFLRKAYFELVNASIPSPVLASVFAVKSSLLQFKPRALYLDDADTLRHLKGRVEDVRESLRHTVLVQAATIAGPAADLTSKPDRADFEYEVVRYTHDSLEVRVNTSAPGVLYWADGHDSSWRAFLDGRETPLLRANLAFKAIAVPQGRSHVRFMFDPWPFKLGLGLFYGALLVCALGGGIPTVWRERSPRVT